MRRLMLSLCTVLTGWAVAGEEASLAHLLPEDTPAYIESTSPPLAELKQMTMARMLEDPRMAGLVQRTAEKDTSFSNMHLDLGSGRSLRVRTNMLASPTVSMHVRYVDEKGERSFEIQNRFAFAWCGFFDDERMPLDFVTALELNTDPREAIATIERVLAAVSLHLREPDGGDVEAEVGKILVHSEYAGVSISSAALGPVQLHVAPVGRRVVVATSLARIRDILDRHGDGAAPSLAGTERFRRMLAATPGPGSPLTRVMISVDYAVAALTRKMPQQAMQIQSALNFAGLEKLESVTTASRVDGPGVTATTSVNFTDAKRRGLARLFSAGPPAKLECLAFAPKDTLYVNCGSFDTKGLYQMFVELLGMHVAMVQGRFEKGFGLKLREDLLDLIGPEMAIIVAPNKGLLPDVAIVLESPDARKLEQNLLSMLDRVPWPEKKGVVTFDVKDVKVHSVPLGGKGIGAPIAPTFGVVDGRLLITAYPLSFQRILAVKRGDKPGLQQNRDFARLKQRVPRDAMGISYLDMGRLFEVIYETGIPLLQSMTDAGPTQLFEFPDVEVFTDYMYGRIAWRTADDSGLKWCSHSPMDTSGFALSLLAGAGLATYWVVEAKAEPEAKPLARAKRGEPAIPAAKVREARDCLHRVRFLKSRMLYYRKEHGKLPATLDELKSKWVDPNNFLVPGTPEKSYCYYGPGGKGRILLHGYPNGAGSRISILTRKLEPRRVTQAELDRLLSSKGDRGAR